MRFLLEPLFDPDETAELRNALLSEQAIWEDGSLSAGIYTKASKNNWQLDRETPLFEQLQANVVEAMLAHPLVRSAALPLSLHSVLFSRTEAGQGYGQHVDNPYMAGGRTDLSFTVFLSEPDQYAGGELTIHHPGHSESFKLPAGHVIVYPSSMLHQVEPVQSGQRLVAVGWLQSVVRDAQQRELLFELETACRALASRVGRCDELDLLYKCHANLLRQWGG
jgi:PKHD-type hydroxylase